MSVNESIVLAAAATVAGLMNAVAGGGTLVTFPVLLLTGTPPIVANATSTLALMIGTAGGGFAYSQKICVTKRRSKPILKARGSVGLGRENVPPPTTLKNYC